MLEHKFEFNAFLNEESFGLNGLDFQEITFTGDIKTTELRKHLTLANVIWYRTGNKILFLGNKEPLQEGLKEIDITISNYRHLEFIRMLATDQYEIALRYMLNFGFEWFFATRDFRPYFQKSFYPYFGTLGDFKVSTILQRNEPLLLTKYGLIYDLTISPQGNIILWLDLKNMTFIQLQSNQLSPKKSVFVFSPNRTCPCEHCSFLSYGALTVDPNKLSGTPQILDCYQSANDDELIPIRAKKNRKTILAPYSWVFETASTTDLKRLGVFEQWRSVTLKSPPERHQLTWRLLNFLADEENKLKIEFPNNGILSFPLLPIKIEKEMKFL